MRLMVCVCAMMSLSLLVRGQYFFYNEKYLENTILFEIGTGIGAMNCLTDVGGRKGNGKKFLKDLDLHAFNASLHFTFGATYKGKLAARVQFTTGKVEGADHRLGRFANNSGGRYQRNLSFSSQIREWMLLFDLYPFDGNSNFRPYISTGISKYHFSPMAKLNDTWYQLHPLRTEGQGIGGSAPYDLTQFAWPFGAGVRIDVTAILGMRLEITHRILFTDHLDDVSGKYADPRLFMDHLPPGMAMVAIQLADRRRELDPLAAPATGQQRGNPNDNDAWFTIDLTAIYSFRSKR